MSQATDKTCETAYATAFFKNDRVEKGERRKEKDDTDKKQSALTDYYCYIPIFCLYSKV